MATALDELLANELLGIPFEETIDLGAIAPTKRTEVAPEPTQHNLSEVQLLQLSGDQPLQLTGPQQGGTTTQSPLSAVSQVLGSTPGAATSTASTEAEGYLSPRQTQDQARRVIFGSTTGMNEISHEEFYQRQAELANIENDFQASQGMGGLLGGITQAIQGFRKMGVSNQVLITDEQGNQRYYYPETNEVSPPLPKAPLSPADQLRLAQAEKAGQEAEALRYENTPSRRKANEIKERIANASSAVEAGKAWKEYQQMDAKAKREERDVATRERTAATAEANLGLRGEELDLERVKVGQKANQGIDSTYPILIQPKEDGKEELTWDTVSSRESDYVPVMDQLIQRDIQENGDSLTLSSDFLPNLREARGIFGTVQQNVEGFNRVFGDPDEQGFIDTIRAPLTAESIKQQTALLKGQGQVSDKEREMVQNAAVSTNSSEPVVQYLAVRTYNDTLVDRNTLDTMDRLREEALDVGSDLTSATMENAPEDEIKALRKRKIEIGRQLNKLERSLGKKTKTIYQNNDKTINQIIKDYEAGNLVPGQVIMVTGGGKGNARTEFMHITPSIIDRLRGDE